MQNEKYAGIVIAAGFAAAMFISASNAVTSSSISREGQNLYVSKYLPAPYKVQIMAKVLSGVVISLIGLTLMLIIAGVLLKIPLYMIILIAIAALVGIIFISFTGVIIDLFNPKLHWDNEQKAVKQNLNVLFNMLVGAIFAGLTVFVSVEFEFDIFMVCGIIFIGFGLMDVMLYRFISSKGVKLFNGIEV